MTNWEQKYKQAVSRQHESERRYIDCERDLAKKPKVVEKEVLPFSVALVFMMVVVTMIGWGGWMFYEIHSWFGWPKFDRVSIQSYMGVSWRGSGVLR